MTTDPSPGYFSVLGHSLTIDVIIPMVMFVTMFLVLWYLLAMAQKKTDFNIEKIFMDDNGKPSVMAIISLMAFATSVWFLAAGKLSGKADPSDFLYFLMFWSGAPVAIEFAKKWDGHLPGTKVIAPTQVNVDNQTPAP